MKDDKEIKIVVRGGGLAETNSSSSHALSICGESDSFAKPGDPEFDLDIRDNVLYVPERLDDFGWEYVKSNSCELKLQYVCGLVFNSWSPLHGQKGPKKLETVLKNYLGVSDVVFEWEKKYIDSWREHKCDNTCGESYLASPEIDHQSREDSREEILESTSTIINFIFNKKSWFFGGNDNSDAPDGFYSEMCSPPIDDVSEPNATLSAYYGGELGRVDFRVDMLTQYCLPSSADFLQMIDDSDNFRLFRFIAYNSSEKKFYVLDPMNFRKSSIAEISYVDPKTNKAYLVYLTEMGTEKLLDILKDEGKSRYNLSASEILSKIPNELVVLVPIKLVSDEFGEIFVP